MKFSQEMIPHFVLYSLLSYMHDKGKINFADYMQYCKNISIDNYQKIFTRDYDASISKQSELHPNGTVATDELLAMAQLVSQDIVLDAGTGHGGTACYIAKKYNCHVIGIDYDPIRIIDALYRSKILEITNVEFQVDNAYQMSFHDDTFDLVLRQHSVYGDEEEKFVAEASRVLKKNGRLAIQGIFKKRVFGTRLTKLEDYSFQTYKELLMKYWLHIEEFEKENSTAELLESYKINNQNDFVELVKNEVIYGFKLIARRR